MRQAFEALLLGLVLCAGLSHASDGTEHDKTIRDFVNKMSLEELVGQTLMVGYMADSQKLERKAKRVSASNNGLLDLVGKYKLGAVILFKHNFDEGTDDESTWEQIHSLTSDLQNKAYKAGSKDHRAPLLIAIDQEGGARVRIEHSVTRVPDPMHIGATRSEERAYEAGNVIGSEMRRLGINTVLAPVADINNNDLKDVIGKRAFGANKDVVAPLSVQFMRGLQAGRVLSFAKHFPGHGDAEEDPHLHLPKVNYRDAARLREWDMHPFGELIKHGVNGMLTAHLLGPLDPANPVTISYKTVQSDLRERLAFQGIILTDDLADMIGIRMDADNRIIRGRQEAAIAALDAGHDMVMFAFVRPDDKGSPERRLTVGEFDHIYQALLSHYNNPGKREELEEKVTRIIKQKTSLLPFDKFQDRKSWIEPLSLKGMLELRGQNDVIAKNIFRESVVLISERGQIINDMNESRLYGNGEGPLSRNRILGDPNSELLVVTPVVKVDLLTPAIRAHNHHWLNPGKVTAIPLVYGWSCLRINEARDYWRRNLAGESVSVDCYVRTSADGSKIYDDDNIARKADEIHEKAKDKPLVIFGIVTLEQVKILQKFLAQPSSIPNRNVIVLVYTEPYLLPLEIYERKEVTVIELSEWPSAELTADVLFGYNVTPKDVSYMPFSLRPVITRDTVMGHPVAAAPADGKAEHAKLIGSSTTEGVQTTPDPKPPNSPQPTLEGASLGTLFGIVGGLIFFLLPRNRVRWAAELESQYNLKDLGWSLALGGGTGLTLYLLAPALQKIEWEPFTLGAINQPAVLYTVIFLAGFAAPALWLRFISIFQKK